MVPAARVETLQAGTLRFEIRISGQEPDSRPGEWYEMPRLHLLISGQEFVMPFGWAQFSELLQPVRLPPRPGSADAGIRRQPWSLQPV